MKEAGSRMLLTAVLFSFPLAVALGASRSSSEEPDPYEGTQILVETFLVEVPLTVLQEAEISPVGEKPNGVTVTKLIWCLLHDNDAQVTSGAKVGVRHRYDAQVRESGRIPYKLVSQVKDKEGNVQERERWEDYSVSKELVSTVRVYHEQDIRMEYGYTENRIVDPLPKENKGPVKTRNYQWQGTVSLKDGIPEIVGSIQDKEKAIFLVLVATIQHKPDMENDAPAL